MPILHADLTLTHRLERAESYAGAAFASWLGQPRPDAGAAVEPLAGDA